MSELTPIQIVELIDNLRPGEGLDLSGKDLEGIDLSSENATKLATKYGENLPRGLLKHDDGNYSFQLNILYEEELRHVNLQGARLCDANLAGVDLDGANLQEADLTGASLRGAYLADANLMNSWLWGVDLQEAYLSSANLKGARLFNVNLANADLERADLQGAALYGTNFQNARLLEADLRGAKFSDETILTDRQRGETMLGDPKKEYQEYMLMTAAAVVAGVDMRGADLEFARLDGVDLFRAHLGYAYLYRTSIDDATFKAEQLKPEIGEESAKVWDLAQEAYLSLKNHFKNSGRYDDARWAYVKEKKMERKTYFPSDSGIDEKFALLPEDSWRKKLGPMYRFWLYLKLFFRPKDVHVQRWLWLRNLAWELSSNYGDSILLPILWAILVVFAVSPLMLYGVSGIVANGIPVSYGDYVIFSMNSFAGLSFADLNSYTSFTKVWSSLEAAAGVATFATVMYVLGRRLGGA